MTDSIPSHFFKQIVDTIGPDLVFFINMCLSTGTVPDCLKHASVTPRLKKPNLDVSDLQYVILDQFLISPLSQKSWKRLYLLSYTLFWILIHYMILFRLDLENYTALNLLYWK